MNEMIVFSVSSFFLYSNVIVFGIISWSFIIYITYSANILKAGQMSDMFLPGQVYQFGKQISWWALCVFNTSIETKTE